MRLFHHGARWFVFHCHEFQGTIPEHGPTWSGAIGHIMLDRAIQRREEYANKYANGWPCGVQDGYGEFTEWARKERARLNVVRGSEDTRMVDRIYREAS